MREEGVGGAESWLQILSQVLITLFINSSLTTTTTTNTKGEILKVRSKSVKLKLFKNMFADGVSRLDIMKRLKISRRSYFYYLKETKEEGVR